VTAGVLAIVLGWLGVHKFYLGYIGTGFIFIGIAIIGAFIFIGPLITGVIGIIEGIRYLNMTDDQFDQTYVKNSKLWF
jgi:TM2 domain-containing membrane protein YozV